MGKKENYTHILLNPEMARMRALSKAIGYDDEDMHRFRIGIQNTWSETAAGHMHLRPVTEAVKAGIWQWGGTPIEFGGYGGCPISLGMNGHRYDTPSRDIMAMDLETCSALHAFDGLVLISSCDKNVPAHLLAAARINIPTIIVLGGPMASGRFKHKDVDMSDLDPLSWACETNSGLVDFKMVEEMTEQLCPGPGSCALMGTANTMQCLTEAMGMALPGNATTIAGSSQLLRLAKNAGRRIVELVDQDIKPSDVITKESMENAIRVLHAIGGGTNAIVHLLALSYELGLMDTINLDTIERIGKETPCITPIKPSGPYHLDDLGEAGGIAGVMKSLGEMLHTGVIGVSGNSVKDIQKLAKITNKDVIHSMNNPVFQEGLYVLRGNLAESAIVRPTVVAPNMYVVTGKARTFNSMETCLSSLKAHEIHEGDVIVLRYEGPRGGPGLTDVFKVMGYLVSLNLEKSCVVITDGKISGFAKGPFICQVYPEAAEGGPIALVQDGDLISIDLPKRELTLHVSNEELNERRNNWVMPNPRVSRGVLTLYAKQALPVTKGAGLPLTLSISYEE